MKRLILIFIIGFLVSQSVLNAKDYTDKKYKFSISVPSTWKVNIHKDGTDKVYDFLSPDENVFVQVRSFRAGPGLSMDLLTRVFEESYLPAKKQKQGLKSITSSNSIPGKHGSYLARYKGHEVGITVFYVIQKGQGYTVMAIVPTSMFRQKQTEISGILKSFRIPGYTWKKRKPQTELDRPEKMSGKVQSLPPKQTTSQQTVSQQVEPRQTKPRQVEPQHAEPQQTIQQPYDVAQLFTGSRIEGNTAHIPQPRKKRQKQTENSKSNSGNTDPYNVAAQRAFWANVPISNGEWKEEPLKSSMMIKSLSSSLINWNVLAVGTRKNTMYAPHVMTIKNGREKPNRHSFSFLQDNRHYAVDDAKDVFSLGRRFNWICGRKGLIMFSNKGGDTWYAQQTPTRKNLNSISFANNNYGMAVGDKGTILITNDGGQHWVKSHSPTTTNLSRIEMVNENTAYILPLKTGNLKGQVLKSVDGGKTWNVHFFDSYTQTGYFMNGMSFVDEDHGWICGNMGSMFYTENGGKNWVRQGSAMAESSHQNLHDVYFVNQNEGWACGNKGTLLHTENGGRKWKKVDLGISYSLNSLEFNGPYMGWVAGTYYVLRYYDKQGDKYTGGFYKLFREPNAKNKILHTSPDSTYVIKGYEIFDFQKRSIVPMNQFSGYGFYLSSMTNNAVIMGGLLPTKYADIKVNIPVDRSKLYRQSSDRYTAIPLHKVCLCYAPGGGNPPKVVFQKFEIISENGEQIPRVSFRIVYPAK